MQSRSILVSEPLAPIVHAGNTQGRSRCSSNLDACPQILYPYPNRVLPAKSIHPAPRIAYGSCLYANGKCLHLFYVSHYDDYANTPFSSVPKNKLTQTACHCSPCQPSRLPSRIIEAQLTPQTFFQGPTCIESSLHVWGRVPPVRPDEFRAFSNSGQHHPGTATSRMATRPIPTPILNFDAGRRNHG